MSRLDVYLVENNMVKSREKAKRLVKENYITVNSKPCNKVSTEILDNDVVEISDEAENYVSRGFIKLFTAYKAFKLDTNNLICADIGASTGGFTECMLDNGASFVYAVDVGHGQLDNGLCENARVKNCEGVNARYITPDFFDKQPQFISVDLSFISLKLVMPALTQCLCDKGEMVVLIKPQFECGKQALNKKGIVKDKKDHIRILEELILFFGSLGLYVTNVVVSSIKGGDGNVEYLAHMKKQVLLLIFLKKTTLDFW